MTREKLDKIRARYNAAIPGKWTAAPMTNHKSRRNGNIHYIPNKKTAEYIACTRQDIPDLLEYIAALETAVKSSNINDCAEGLCVACGVCVHRYEPKDTFCKVKCESGFTQWEIDKQFTPAVPV
jgi:hypothetical protein